MKWGLCSLILSTARYAIAAPTAERGTGVSSAPNPLPNTGFESWPPVHNENFKISTENEEDEKEGRIENGNGKRVLKVGLDSDIPTREKVPSPDTAPKPLIKRQTRQRGFSAPARLNTLPNTNAEEDAIANAADTVKHATDNAANRMEQIADDAVRNAAQEQQQGVDNPNFFQNANAPSPATGWDSVYVWPSGVPIQVSWPTDAEIPRPGTNFQPVPITNNPPSNGMQAGAEQYFDPTLFNDPQADFQVLDGTGNPLQNNALQPQPTVPGWQNGAEQYFDPSLSNDQPQDFQVLNGLGNPIKDNALQPAANIPKPQNDIAQYFDPGLFNEPDSTGNFASGDPIHSDVAPNGGISSGSQSGPEQFFQPSLPSEPGFQVLDGLGDPIKDNALQPEPNVPGWQNGAEQHFDPSLFNTNEEPFQVLDGLGNPIKDNAVQPEANVPVWQNGAEQFFDPTLFNEPAQVLDGTGNPLRDNALQPDPTVPGWQNGPEQFFDPGLFNENDQSSPVLDGLGNPIKDNALQPEATVPGWQNGAEEHFDPSLFDSNEQPLQVLDGLGNPIKDNALQPEANVPGWQNGPEQVFDPELFNTNDQPFQVLDGQGNPLKNDAMQPDPTVPGWQTDSEQPFQVLDGLGNQVGNDALQPDPTVPGWDNGPEQYFDPSLFDSNDQPFQVLDGLGNPIKNDALQPNPMVPGSNGVDALSDPEIGNQIGQTGPGQAIDAVDNLALPAIVSAPELWRQVLDDPNVQQFLQDNTPNSLQPLLDQEIRNELETQPSTEWQNILPGVNNAMPETITPFLNLLDSVTPQQQSDLIIDGPGIVDAAVNNPIAMANVFDQVDAHKGQQPFGQQMENTPFPYNGFNQAQADPNGDNFGDASAYLLPEMPGVNHNFDGTINTPLGNMPDPVVHMDSGGTTFTPNGFDQNPTGAGGGIADTTPNQIGNQGGSGSTNPLLSNNGMFTFNCVPVYVDANGVQRPFNDILAQTLSALNVNVANFGAMGQGPATSITQSTPGSPDPPLAPLLSEVISNNPDEIVSASQISPNTVLINKDGVDDAEEVVTNFNNGYRMTAVNTGGPDTFDSVTLEKGGTKFDINNPIGFDTVNIMNAAGPGDILNEAFNDGASVVVESSSPA
ncbi:hypothetical protein H072_10088 [Dactylellina haptotyla CBS 200.50]|uniref:Uncharacterized protein n=1 Tax=Dactylellina haptotyla (strain CBS 200.50) TaxID=1284197 RepID=S8BMI6_DACHA|nr:hypothetical protein H072_10088 [Dactylellina haptotyla CBS 200.50]